MHKNVAFLIAPNMKTRFPVTTQFGSEGRREQYILLKTIGATWKRSHG